MLVIIIKILIVLNLPLAPLILVRGLRLDRIFFAFYLVTFLFASYFLVQPPEPYSLHLVLLLTTLNLLWMNLFFITQWNVRNLLKYRQEKIFSFSLLPFPILLAALFCLDYSPELFRNNFCFPQPLYPALTLISAVLSLLMLTMGWERLERIQPRSKGERIFRMGIIMWWLVYFFILSQMIYTGDLGSILFFQSLFCFQLFWFTGIYPLIFKKDFLEVRAHPSPQFVGRITQSILVLGVLTLFFWLEAFSKKWELPHYSVTLVSVVLLAGVLLFPLFPFRPFEAFQRILYHHLYLPEQDFALEVSLYLKVMRGEENVERIMDHLRERLKVHAAALYRSVKKEKKQWNLHISSPPSDLFPLHLNTLPGPGEILANSPLIKAIPLKAREETLGHLLLLGEKTNFYFEEEGMIRFWSRTLGLLLKELDLKEKKEEQEKLTHFSQATSFLLHDAKNLAQLLELLLKNCQNLKGEELTLFFKESLPALEQARTRARRILEKLETFQPDIRPVLKDNDIQQILEGCVNSMRLSLKRKNISLQSKTVKSSWKGDPNSLKTVVENLILNALQAEANNEKVEVILEEKENGYHIQVKDEGAGIPRENREKIFEPFFTTKQGGSGLGLYQARVLLERIGGKIWYKPNIPTGSIFHVWVGKNSYR